MGTFEPGPNSTSPRRHGDHGGTRGEDEENQERENGGSRGRGENRPGGHATECLRGPMTFSILILSLHCCISFSCVGDLEHQRHSTTKANAYTTYTAVCGEAAVRHEGAGAVKTTHSTLLKLDILTFQLLGGDVVDQGVDIAFGQPRLEGGHQSA